jgi:hypothetical protein
MQAPACKRNPCLRCRFAQLNELPRAAPESDLALMCGLSGRDIKRLEVSA